VSPAKKPKLPVDVYVRVSQTAGRQGDSFQSPKQQEERCRAQLAADGLEVGEVFTDLDQSGAKASRPDFDRMMQRVRDGRSGGVIVYDLSRFGRNTRNVLDGVDEVESRGAVFISCNEKLDTSTASGRFVLTLFAALREMERDQLKERIGTSQAAAVARGIHITRHAPPGYRRKEDGRLEPDPKHGATLSQAFELAASGESHAAVAAFLTERGFPSGGKAATWRSSRIARLLGNRAYLGEARYGSIVNANGHEPLVDAVTWKLAQRRPGPAPTRKASALLAGIVRCDCCRYALRGSHSKTRVSTYECRSFDRPGARCERQVAVSMGRLDDYVLSEWFARWFKRATIFDISEEVVDDSEQQAAIEEARQGYADVAALEGHIPAAAYEAALAAALAALEEAEAAPLLAVSVSQAVDVDLPPMLTLYERYTATTAAGGRFRESIDAEQIPDYRALLARDIQAVFVGKAASRNPNLPIGDRVRIVWAGEDMPELPKRGKRLEGGN
jgi:DNA invertase Pin-like site-specific DNA recombinase